jgi:RNA polymerase sigma factor (sigma-70 family)
MTWLRGISSPESLGSPRAARALACVLVLLFGVALVLSAVHGTSKRLPGIALAWPALLVVERAAAGTAVVAVVFIVLLNLLRGLLPIELGTGGMKFQSVVVPDAQGQKELEQAAASLRTVQEAVQAATSALRPLRAQSEDLKVAGAREDDDDAPINQWRLNAQFFKARSSTGEFPSGLDLTRELGKASELIDRAARRARITQAIAVLPQGAEREVLTLVYFQHTTLEEAAKMLGRRLGEVQQQYTSAILRLRETLDDEDMRLIADAAAGSVG